MDPQLKKALDFMQWNGFGFERSGEQVIFANLGEQDVNLAQLGKIATCQLLDSLRNQYVSVHYSDYRKIPALIQTMIDLGLAVKPHIRDAPVRFHREKFSWAALESKIVDLQEQSSVAGLAKLRGTDKIEACYTLYNQPIAWNQEWNWHTEKGKQFSKLLPTTTDFDFFKIPGISEAIEKYGLDLWNVGNE